MSWPSHSQQQVGLGKFNGIQSSYSHVKVLTGNRDVDVRPSERGSGPLGVTVDVQVYVPESLLCTVLNCSVLRKIFPPGVSDADCTEMRPSFIRLLLPMPSVQDIATVRLLGISECRVTAQDSVSTLPA